MYAQVNKKKPMDNIYSDLGAGGGRTGPKPHIERNIYAEAKIGEDPSGTLE